MTAPSHGPAGVDWPALRRSATEVAGRAFAPHSGLSVGAAGLTDSGAVVTGCNVENASFGLTLCAECGLVSALRAAGEQRIVALSVVAGDGQPLAPCGRCRQVLLDHGGETMVIDQGPGNPTLTLADLLPHSFSTKDLFSRRG